MRRINVDSKTKFKTEGNKWIQKAVKRKGRIKKALGVPQDKKIPESKMPALRKLAKQKTKVSQLQLA